MTSIGKAALPRAFPRLGPSQASVAFVPLSADGWGVSRPPRLRLRRGLSGPPPFRLTRWAPVLPFLSPSFSRGTKNPRGKGRPVGPRMSRARLPVDRPCLSALPALRVRPGSDGNAAAGSPRFGGRPRCLGGRGAGGTHRLDAAHSVSGGVTAPPGHPGAREPPLPLVGRGPRHGFLGRKTQETSVRLRPQIRRDNPLNLSILLSGGKETNQDSLSSGERRGKSPAPNPRPTGGRGKCGVRKTVCPVSLGGLSPSDRGSARGRCEAGNGPRRAGARSSRSRVVCECSPKRVVNSI